MGMYAVEADESGELAELQDAAREGRAAAVARRRQVSQGKQALNGDGNGTAAAAGAGAPPAAENLNANGAGAPPTAANGQGAPPAAESVQVDGAGAPPAASNGQGAPGGTAVATDGVGDAQLGRALSMQRRRQLSKGKQALNGDGTGTAAAAGAGAPPAAESVQVDGAGAPPAASSGQGAAGGVAVATDGVGDAQLGRALSMQRRRQLSKGKQALNGDGTGTAAAAGAGARPAAQNVQVDGAGSGREQAQVRRGEESRFGSAGLSRPQREGRVEYPPKVNVSPTHGDQRVTGLRIGSGVRVTGDEPGAALPVSGTQYVSADGPAPALDGGPKVGQVRTPKGLVVSGTTVRSKVSITGDEAGEHLPVTGEADQKFDDDLTPREDGAYRPAQFPRRADPHGVSAVAQPRMAASSGDGPALANTDGKLAVTGTAVGRSARVTGNEAGVCRPITGDQYQDPFSYSSECGGTGGGTAPAAHLDRGRLDPVTAGKVTEAQTWGGQRVTGPNVEHRPNATGDEPGTCRPLTGTPYQGPSTAFGWCEPDEGESAAQRLEPRPEGVALTGDLPMPSKKVTGTERGQQNTITGSSYYRDMRPAEPAADDWARSQAFPVALARRLAGGESDDATAQQANGASPASTVPGSITGSFAIDDGKVTGNNEFLFRPRPNRDGKQPEVTGEGRTDGREITGSAWTVHDRVTGTEGYIAAGRNPSEGGGGPNGWAGTLKFRHLATPGEPRQEQKVTGRSGWNAQAAATVTVSGGAQG